MDSSQRLERRAAGASSPDMNGSVSASSTPPLLIIWGWGAGHRVANFEGKTLFAKAKAWSLKHGVAKGADWMEQRGIPRELAIYALVGSRNAYRYGARPVLDLNNGGS